MSAYLYDNAVVEDLRRIIGDSRIGIIPVENVYDVIPRMDNDKLTLPLVTVTRTSWEIQSDDVNHSAKYEGALSQIIPNDPKFNETRIQKFQFMPMRLEYAIDIWTRTRRENDEFVRELFWYYSISPTLRIKVPYDLDFDHNFNLFIEPSIIDNSDVTQHKLKGEMFRQTLSIYTDDAKLWKSSSRSPTTIDIDFEITPQDILVASMDETAASED